MKDFNPLRYPQCFSVVQRLAPSTWTGHIPFAMFLTGVLKPRVIVELGTFYGTSYCAFCQAVRELKLDARCYAVDTWEGDPQSGFYGAEIFDDLKNYHDPLYGDFSRLIQSTFDEALVHFTDATIDLLHIDGFHTYEAVRADFEAWLPKMSERGVMLFHDINVRERDFGVWKFWEEIRRKYPHYEFAHSHGLGVLAVGENLPAEFRDFLECAAHDRVTIANFFYEQGRRLENLQELQTGRQTVSEQTEIINRLRENERRLAVELHEREEQIAALETKARVAEAQNATIERLQKEIETGKKAFAALERKFEENEARNLAADKLKRELEAERERLAEKLQTASEKSAELEEKERFLNNLSQRLIAKSRNTSEQNFGSPAALIGTSGVSPADEKIIAELAAENARNEEALRLVLGVVTYNNSPEQLAQLLKSVELAAEKLSNLPIEIKIYAVDNGQPSDWAKSRVPLARFASEGNVGFGSAMNRLMAAAFADPQTRWFLCLNPDGTLHRNALKELIKMSDAYPDSLIEARQFPEEHTKEYDAETFETAWASGACLLISRDIYSEIGGFDPNFFMYLEDVDLSWRARAAGFSVKIAPQAIFGHAVLNREFSVAGDKNMLLSGRYLALKWENPNFARWAENELVARRYYPSPAELPRLPRVFQNRESINPQIPNFEHYFSFSATRW